MYIRLALARSVGFLALVLITDLASVPLGAQAPATAEEPQQPAAPAENHGGHHMQMGMQMSREGSGTSWLPDNTPMYAIHWQRGPWQLMAHENAFVQLLHESGDRGSEQFGSVQLGDGHGTAERGKRSPDVSRYGQPGALDHRRLWLS
jgi:hypothetical protein